MVGDLKAAIGSQVKSARSAQNMTQSELAAAIGRSVEAVSNIERAVSLPALDTLESIAAATGKPIVFFFNRSAFVDPDVPRPRQEKMRRLKDLCDRLTERDLDVAIRQVEALVGRGK